MKEKTKARLFHKKLNKKVQCGVVCVQCKQGHHTPYNHLLINNFNLYPCSVKYKWLAMLLRFPMNHLSESSSNATTLFVPSHGNSLPQPGQHIAVTRHKSLGRLFEKGSIDKSRQIHMYKRCNMQNNATKIWCYQRKTVFLRQLKQVNMTNHDFQILYKRFSPSEQYGCREGGRIHVIASLLAGAEVGTDQLSAPEGSFKREQQLAKIQEKRISHN